MNAQKKGRCVARARIIKALAHPTRLFMAEELARRGELCVCKLTEMVGADMSTISRHLAMLKSAGVVQDEKRGTQVYYRLIMESFDGFLDCVENMLKQNAKEQQRLLA